VEDYAGAWTAQRGRCHRFVYTEDDRSSNQLPGAPVTQDGTDGLDRWYAVQAWSRDPARPSADSLGASRSGRGDEVALTLGFESERATISEHPVSCPDV